MIRTSYYEHHDRKSHTLRTLWSEHHIMSIMIVDHIPNENHDPNIILWASWSLITYLTNIIIRTSYYEHHDRKSHTLRTLWSEQHIMSIMIVDHIPYEHHDPNIILWASWSWITYLTNIMIDPNIILWASWSLITYLTKIMIRTSYLIWASWSLITYLTNIMIRTSYYEHHDRWSHTLRTSWVRRGVWQNPVVKVVCWQYSFLAVDFQLSCGISQPSVTSSTTSFTPHWHIMTIHPYPWKFQSSVEIHLTFVDCPRHQCCDYAVRYTSCSQFEMRQSLVASRQTGMPGGIQADAGIQAGSQANKQACMQAGRQACRQTGRQSSSRSTNKRVDRFKVACTVQSEFRTRREIAPIYSILYLYRTLQCLVLPIL